MARPELCDACASLRPCISGGRITCRDVQAAWDAGRAEGERATTDAAVQRIAESAVNCVSEPVAYIDQRTPREVQDMLIARLRSLAGSPPPKSYDDGLRKAAEMARKEADAHKSFQQWQSAAVADRVAIMIDAIASGAKADE